MFAIVYYVIYTMMYVGELVSEGKAGDLQLEVLSGSPVTNNFYLGTTAGEVLYICDLFIYNCIYIHMYTDLWTGTHTC